MDPSIDPSEILPVDFLPKGLRDADETQSVGGGAGILLKDVAAAQRESSVRTILWPDCCDGRIASPLRTSQN